MKKNIALCTVLLFLLAACAPSSVIPTQGPIKDSLDVRTPQVVETEPVEGSSTALVPTVTILPTIEFTASPAAECSVSPVVPEGNTLAENGVPQVSDGEWAYGTKTPSVTILAYCNYQRAACKTLVLNLAKLQEAHQDAVRIVLRHYPQPEVDKLSVLAAQAAEAAGLQNRFWQMNSLLYTEQSNWASFAPEEFQAWVSDQAVSLGISKTRFEADMNSAEVAARIDKVVEEAAPLKITDAPVLFYNGILVTSKVNLESLEVLVNYFLLPEKAYTECPEMTVDPLKEYLATFKTEKGEIVFELYPDKAPWAVNSFVFLSREGWFNGTDFFRVVPGLVVQGGDPSNSGLGRPGYIFSDEVDPALRFDKAGVLAMTNAAPNMNGSQFFVTYTALPELDGKYTIFGQVIKGMEVLNSLRPRNPEADEILLPADKLISVTIEEK